MAEEVEATRLRSRTALIEQVRNEFSNSIRAYDEQVSRLQRQIGGLEQKLRNTQSQTRSGRSQVMWWIGIVLALFSGLLLGRFL